MAKRTTSEERDFISLQCKLSLGTREIVKECGQLLGRDEMGRTLPDYYVLHKALVEMRDRLKVEQQDGGDNAA